MIVFTLVSIGSSSPELPSNSRSYLGISSKCFPNSSSGMVLEGAGSGLGSDNPSLQCHSIRKLLNA